MISARFGCVVWIYAFVSSSCLVTNAPAAEDPGYETASKEAQRLFYTPEGHIYVLKFMHDIAKPVMNALKKCDSGRAAHKLASDTVFIVSANGRITRVLSKKDNAFALCITANLQPPKIAARPPRDSWPIQIHVLNYPPSSKPPGPDFPALTIGFGSEKAAATQRSEGPKDNPLRMTSPGQVAAHEKAIAPYIKKGRATYPAAKKRFLAGLPAGHKFFVKKPLRDKNGIVEDSFIAVVTIKGGQITGTIDSELGAVRNYKTGQRIVFPETDVDDWLILRPDGTEEGNFVGKFIDTVPR